MVSHKGRKAKGSKAERELVSRFWANGWAAFRSAGSGSQQFPSPDIMAGNGIKQLAIEVKVSADDNKYFAKEEITALKYFADKFGAQPWTCIKFGSNDYTFVHIEDLDETPASYKASKKLAELKGLSFEEVLK